MSCQTLISEPVSLQLSLRSVVIFALVLSLMRMGSGTFTKARFDTAKDELSKRKCDTPASGSLAPDLIGQEQTPLHIAVAANLDHLVPKLLNYGADLQAVNKAGLSVFEHAMYTCRWNIVEMIIYAPSLKNVTFWNGYYGGHKKFW